MPFILRLAGSDSLPQLADCWGRQLTEGRLVYYNFAAGRTSFLIFFARGGKYGLDGLDFFRYRGVAVPEFQAGHVGDEAYRNWRFHRGTVTRQITVGPGSGFNDPDQGRPQFFPLLNNTFSNISYIEGMLPADLSDSNEPTGFQFGLRGRRIADFDSNGTLLSVGFSANNARVYADIVLNELKRPASRINWASWASWKTACEQLVWHRIAANTAVAGSGLSARYYNGENFEFLVVTRTDADINFNWGNASPASGVNSDHFSVRWEGKIKPQYTETYTFTIEHDDGVRLWINNQLIIDHWATLGTHSGTISMIAGQAVNIRVECREDTGPAYCILKWQSASRPAQVVPTDRLYPLDGQIKRYEAHLVFANSTPAWAALGEVLKRSPGYHVQDVNGKLKFLPPNRQIAHTFVYDPAAAGERWNIAAGSFEAAPRRADERANWRLHFYRDLLEELYAEKWVEGDRPELRDRQGGLPTDSTPARWGVMTRGLMTRIAETEMRVFSDPDRWFKLRGQIDSYHLAAGDRVKLSHVASKDDFASAIECLVTASTFGDGVADEKSYALLPIAFPYYIDEVV